MSQTDMNRTNSVPITTVNVSRNEDDDITEFSNPDELFARRKARKETAEKDKH